MLRIAAKLSPRRLSLVPAGLRPRYRHAIGDAEANPIGSRPLLGRVLKVDTVLDHRSVAAREGAVRLDRTCNSGVGYM